MAATDLPASPTAALDLRAVDTPALIALTGTALVAHGLAALRSAGEPEVRVSHGYVFQHLLDATPTVSELAVLLEVTQQAASKVVAQMERLGYLERRADVADSRVRRVRLTARGRRVIDRDRRHRAETEAWLVQEHGADAVRTTRRVLESLLDRSGGTAAVRGRRVVPLESD